MKEVVATLLAVTLIFLLIFLSNQLVRYLSYAAAGKIAASIVIRLMGFEIPYLLALLLPLGLYLGIILAYGRLYADSEMPVLNACGLSLKRVVVITSWVAVGVAVVVLVLMLWVNPQLAMQRDQNIAQNTIIDTLRPGRFQVINDGRWVVYVESIPRSRKQANNVFIAEAIKKPEAGNNTPWVVLSADKGYQEKDPVSHENFVVTSHGSRYEGTPGDNAYKVIQFEKYAVHIPTAGLSSARQAIEAIPSATLWYGYTNPEYAGELQWRLSMPISAMILMLMAIPLSRVRPRQGRYSHLVPAMLLYIIYVDLLFVARNWVDQKNVAIGVGLWWVHLVFLAVGGLLLMVQSDYLWRLPFRKLGRKPA